MSDDPAQDHYQAMPDARKAEILQRLRALGYDDIALARMTGTTPEEVRRLST